MGRETKLLLGLLATLFGVFLGVLSMKLLVPRPPAGAGPDIQADVAATDPQDLVEPPQFTADLPAPPPEEPQRLDEPAPRSRFAAADAGDRPPPARDPFVTRAAFEQPGARSAGPPADLPPIEQPPAPLAGSAYVTRPGDSWWSLAESAYGDGRLYRAVFAWNKSRDPRVSLVPGTPLELPTRDRLEAAWPALVPRP